MTKNWSVSFSVSSSNKYSRLSSLKIDWFDLLAVQGTFKSLLQHHSSKASILWCSAFFTMIKTLSQRYMTTGKMIALTRQTLVGKVIFLLFNTLSRFVIAFLPRNNCLLISWLQSPTAVILEPKKGSLSLLLSFILLFAMKLLQSCPTLCNPIDGSPPGPPVPGILQARTLEWVAISFSNAGK